jgi:hypothetical protein
MQIELDIRIGAHGAIRLIEARGRGVALSRCDRRQRSSPVRLCLYRKRIGPQCANRGE